MNAYLQGRYRAGPMVVITTLLLLLTGLGLAAPGAYLLTLGGSPYYLLAGIGVLVAAFLIARRRASGALVYLCVLLITTFWALAESGLNGWGLMPRIAFLAVGGLWLLLLPRERSAADAKPDASWKLVSWGVPAFAFVVMIAGFVAMPVIENNGAVLPGQSEQGADQTGEWTHTGANGNANRYSPLRQINATNVDGLDEAWTYHSGLKPEGAPGPGGLEVTPIMVDGLLYGCTAYSSVFALDPTTGKEVWRHNPKMDYDGVTHAVCRGVSYYKAPPGTTECPTRILLGTVDNHLIALDAKTGAVCRSFGDNGQVNLLDNLGKFPKGWTYPTSPPTIVNDVAVVGAYVIDGQSTEAPPGVIRGYDAVNGKLLWAFDAGRPQDTRPLSGAKVYTPSTPNAWTLFTGDPALGLVYVPMGNGSPDFYGRFRTPEIEKFTSAVVALDSRTGTVRWKYQTVHHDLWDYDLAAQPVLTDMPVGNGTVPALIQPTKTGQIFVLDRRNGKPVTRVEERAVPRSDIPGERSSPTQPYSTGMPSFAGKLLAERDMWGLSPFDQAYCRIRFKQSRYDGMFTPMGLGTSIRYPGELGGIDWGSVSIDPRRGVMIVNSNLMPDFDQFITREQANAEGLVPKADPRGHNAPGGAMAGTPYGVHWGVWLTGLGVPCVQPPYGMLTAVDLHSRKVIWRRTIGNAANSGPFGMATHLPLPLGAPNIGGSIVTAGGVIFMAATQDQYFRALDEKTGKVLWSIKLPAGGHATPMTYMGRDGHQYVLIAAGGNTSMQTALGDSFISYRLK